MVGSKSAAHGYGCCREGCIGCALCTVRVSAVCSLSGYWILTTGAMLGTFPSPASQLTCCNGHESICHNALSNDFVTVGLQDLTALPVFSMDTSSMHKLTRRLTCCIERGAK